MLKACQYRIYPTQKQQVTFEGQLEACQTLYNQALAWRKQAYEQKAETVKYGVQQAVLTQLRKGSPSGLNSTLMSSRTP